MKMFALALSMLFSLGSVAHGATNTSDGKSIQAANNDYANFKKSNDSQDRFYAGFLAQYQKSSDRIHVPGFISTSPIPEIATIVGPEMISTNYRIGDTIYLRWAGSAPKVGDAFATVTPALVLQNMENPTDFSVRLQPAFKQESLPKNHRLAGYFYESTGRVRITKVGQGIMEGLLEALAGQVAIGDRLMPTLPVIEKLKPISGSIHLSAAIVSGSPPERLSTTRRSFIYINRGSRDGIKVGNVFEAVESVKLDSSAGAAAPEVSAGEAIVVYTSDAYSTAMITQQFDVIRIGALLRAKNPFHSVLPSAPFASMKQMKTQDRQADEIPQAPSIDDFPEDTLPDPMKKQEPTLPSPEPSKSPLSELDQLEQSHKFNALTPEEKLRLGKLSRQEKVGETPSPQDEDEIPAITGVDNSFATGKKPVKKEVKKKKQVNDEEELNQLMMQN
jgi:hypothetical protein